MDIEKYTLKHIERRVKEYEGTPFYIDAQLAKRCVKFVSLLKHTSGEFAGVPFKLLPFQIAFLVDVIATLRRDTHKRKHTYALLFIPRKNGKTELIAALLLYFLFCDKQNGKEIYCAANSTDQAKILFQATQTMIKQNQALSSLTSIYTSYREIRKNKSAFNDSIKVLSANKSTKDGLRPYVFVYDELHAAPDGELYQVISEGMKSRDDALTIVISTAGYNMNGIMYEQYAYAKDVKKGIIKDDSVYSQIYEPKMTAAGEYTEDIGDEALWARVNPALGYGVKLRPLREAYIKAQHSAVDMYSFKTKHLNMWCASPEGFLSDEVFEKCNREAAQLGDVLYMGVDLSSTADLTALAVISDNDGILQVKMHYYVPEATLRRQARTDKVNYLAWVDKGFITPTAGNSVDYDYILKDIKSLYKDKDVRAIGYDRWNSSDFIKKLGDEGLLCVPVGQGYQSMNEALKKYEGLALNGKICFDKNPVLRWNNANLVPDMDAAGNVKPSKKKSTDKIDGISALCTALYVKTTLENADEEANIYNEREMRII